MARKAMVATGAAVVAGGAAAGVTYWLSSQKPPEPVPAEDKVQKAEAIAPPLEAQIKALEAAVEGITKAIADVEKTVQELQTTIAQQDQTIAQLEQAVAGLQERVAQLRAILDEINQTADALAQQNAQAVRLAEELEREYGAKDARFRQLLDLLRQQEQTIQELRAQIARLQQQVELLQAQVAQLEQIVAQLRAQNQRLQALVQQLQAQLQQARQQIDNLNRAINDLKYQLEPIPKSYERNFQDFWCGTGSRRLQTPFVVPYQQTVTLTYTIHAQVKCCGLFFCTWGYGEIRILDAKGKVVFSDAIRGKNSARTKTVQLNLPKGTYNMENVIALPGRSYGKVTVMTPRFLV